MFTHGMEFDLGEDIGALRDMVHRFAQERIKPIAAEVAAWRGQFREIHFTTDRPGC